MKLPEQRKSLFCRLSSKDQLHLLNELSLISSGFQEFKTGNKPHPDPITMLIRQLRTASTKIANGINENLAKESFHLQLSF